MKLHRKAETKQTNTLNSQHKMQGRERNDKEYNELDMFADK